MNSKISATLASQQLSNSDPLVMIDKKLDLITQLQQNSHQMKMNCYNTCHYVEKEAWISLTLNKEQRPLFWNK